MYIFDSHFHLSPEDDICAIIQRANKSGVNGLFVAGASIENTETLLNEISDFQNVNTAIGVHPHDAINFTTLDLFERNVSHPSVKAIGEIGLDYFYDNSPKEIQIGVFKTFLKLANKTKLPVIIHCRDAFNDCYDIIKQTLSGDIRFVIHCFTGSIEWAEKFVALGGYLSFNGIITFKKSEEIRMVLKKIPKNKLLFETDSPYLTPVPFRGKKNEPAFLIHIIEKAADILEISVDELAQLSVRNAKIFYNLT